MQFYKILESIDKTKDYDFSEMSLKDIADNIENGVYVDYDWTRSEILVRCSNCKKVTNI